MACMNPCVSAKSPLNSACREQRASERHPSSRCWVIWRVRMPIRYWTWQEGGGVSKTNGGWMGAVPGASAHVLLFFCTMICGKFVLSLRHSSPWVLKWFCNHRSWAFLFFFFFSFKCPFCNQTGYQCVTLKNKLKQPHVIYVGDVQRRLILCGKIKAEVVKRERIIQLKILFLERNWKKIQEVILKNLRLKFIIWSSNLQISQIFGVKG